MMSDRSTPTSTNSLSKTELPSFVEMLDVPQKNLIKSLWKADDLSISDKIDSIDAISKDMPKKARVEYRKWRFLMDRSKMPDFYGFQNDHIKEIITAMFEKYTDLEEFAQRINSIKSSLNNSDAFDKWMKNEEIEFETGGNNSHAILFYYLYLTNDSREGRICLFNSSTRSVEEIAQFHNWYLPCQVAIIQNNILGISGNGSSEIYDLNTRQTSRGPAPPEWRAYASVAYFKDKLYYLGGVDPKTYEWTNRVDVLIDRKWQIGPALPLPIDRVQTITCDRILYVIDELISNKIYRLSDDERKWIEIGEIPEQRTSFGVASLNGKIYITGGQYGQVFKSCLCVDPSAPVVNRISRIASMNYARHFHSLIVANGKLYAIGGFQNIEKVNDSSSCPINFCDVIEEYDPQTNKWR